MHIKIIRLFFLLSCFLPGLVLAATTQTIHVEWGYIPPISPAVTGFKLYQEGVSGAVCTTANAKATSMDCMVELPAGSATDFTLTAIFDDGTESPRSTPFPFASSVDTLAMQGLPAGQGATVGKQLSFSWEYNQTATVEGFRIYQNSNLLCQTNDPSARQLTCTADLVTIPASYTLTAINADHTETSFSNSIVYAGSISTDTGTKKLKAMIAANTVTGPVPLPVSFDASASTGSVTRYLWDFGDGSTSTAAIASHTYARAGTYLAKLTVADSSGVTDTATVAITAFNPVVAPTLPTAVISSSVAAGPAPLTVSFDGSGSSATNATLSLYTWGFGDGAAGTGATVSHTYTTAGTYFVVLFVIDSKGRGNWALTPVTVTAPERSNEPPQAVISATPTDGPVSLAVTFDGGGSTDSDGRIVNYVWDFGDNGETATGQSVTHTYTTAGSFIATLQVADDRGAISTASITIVANDEQRSVGVTSAGVTIEAGEVAVGNEWVRVPLATPFTNPIVVAGPPSFNDAEPCTVRIRNVDPTGFDIRLTEWNTLDGTHSPETVSYLVMEQGHYILPDGAAVEAGSFTGAAKFKLMAFKSFFAKSPVVLTTVATVNDATTVSGRLRYISPSGFAYSYQEREWDLNNHLDETVHYIAWEPGSGMLGTLQYAVGKTVNSVTDAWYSEHYKSVFPQPPLLLADMQTTNDASPAALRVQEQAATGFQVKVEQAASNETKHAAETAGYIALDQVPAKK
ncbi:PKD domain-containing protein [Desulfobulbus sp.]|uniref:PKD domain-containing protein n=1 Tax=Desulfobulbus sp. TaxID=895 RepID=UPI00286EF997|nr:PKD domain-containing protein [Desulfobulbus sp.]